MITADEMAGRKLGVGCFVETVGVESDRVAINRRAAPAAQHARNGGAVGAAAQLGADLGVLRAARLRLLQPDTYFFGLCRRRGRAGVEIRGLPVVSQFAVAVIE